MIRSKSGGLWEACLGLEVHAQILCNSKLFSDASANIGPYVKPNKHVSLVDAAFPGTLPMLNKGAVHQAIRTGLAFGCNINHFSRFERKHYFYCDLPQGYQITQQASPIASGGKLLVEAPVNENQRKKKKESKKTAGQHAGVEAVGDWEWDSVDVRINRIQLEQDSGKSIHDASSARTLVDLNRAGSALMEIVFEPDLRSAVQVGELVRTLQSTLRRLGTCDGNMEEGSIRCDLNISVRRAEDTDSWGNRVEIKNMNSIKNMVAAAEFEIKRQISALEEGGKIERETRTFDVVSGQTRRLRSKEGAVDYRFFPEPDLPPLIVEQSLVEELKQTLPELPQDTKRRLMEQYGLSSYDAAVLVGEEGAVQYFQEVAQERDAKSVANWIINDLFGLLKNPEKGGSGDLKGSAVSAKRLGQMLDLVKTGMISNRVAKELLEVMLVQDKKSEPKDIVERFGWQQLSDPQEIEKVCRAVVTDPANEKQRAQFRSGKGRMRSFFVGQIMKATNGKANPLVLEEVLTKVLNELLS